MFGFNKRLMNPKIRDFEPLTDNDKTIERKNALLLEIKKRINLEKVKKDCEGNIFSLRVIFYLNKNTTNQGKYQKDLDNMAKIVSDTLSDYLINQDKQKDKKTGLGIIRDDKDIHELHLVKKFVDNDSKQGLDIALYKLKKKPLLTENS